MAPPKGGPKKDHVKEEYEEIPIALVPTYADRKCYIDKLLSLDWS